VQPWSQDCNLALLPTALLQPALLPTANMTAYTQTPCVSEEMPTSICTERMVMNHLAVDGATEEELVISRMEI